MVKASRQLSEQLIQPARPVPSRRHRFVPAASDKVTTDNPIYHCLMMLLLAGQVVVRLLTGRCHRRSIMHSLICAGPGSFMPVLMTNLFAGMIFAIQSAREMTRYGVVYLVGGAFASGYCRELAPILTAAVLACQVGSAFAAEIACMKLTEQIDALKLMRTDPIDFLVVPRVLACSIMLPILTLLGLFVGVLGGLFIVHQFYGVPVLTFFDGIQAALTIRDVITVIGKAVFFGGAIAVASCSRGLTASCHGQGVGQSATSAVVTTWVMLFVLDFLITILLISQGEPGPIT